MTYEVLYRQSETKHSTKQAIFHTQTRFKPNKLYGYTARESGDGKQIFRRNSTTYANGGGGRSCVLPHITFCVSKLADHL